MITRWGKVVLVWGGLVWRLSTAPQATIGITLAVWAGLGVYVTYQAVRQQIN